ncbi:MAG: hypothetical protein HY049_10095 [Acidobacteria bacterium]|nr:hypothetical protein [Acidobacteriota bacterium]
MKAMSLTLLLLLLPTISQASPAEWGPHHHPLPRSLAVITKHILTDPTGDHLTTPGNPIVDITSVDAGSDGITLSMKVNFSPDTDMSQVIGYIELDTDQNPGTGLPSVANYYVPGTTQDIGADYVLDLFEFSMGGQVALFVANNPTPIGTVPAKITGQTLELTVPMAMLRGDDGSMNLGMVLGNIYQPTDVAPEAGHATITARPPSVSGSATGVTTRRVICQNLTTHEEVTIHLAGATTWDCEAAGLVVHPGDIIVQRVKGTAN